jgi:dihydroorotate dehydrogenase electron transfer subunit
MQKFDEIAPILSNTNLIGDYYLITFKAEKIAETAQPGQFVHVKVPSLKNCVLRRPFSIYNTDAEAGTVSVIYKVVGQGTEQLCTVQVGTELDVMGPLGIGFSNPGEKFPIIVAGGYGCAATYMQSKISNKKGIVIIGGRTEGDLLLTQEFADQGYEVLISTNDGSKGTKGFVTTVLKDVLDKSKAGNGPALEDIEIYSCGPNPMLKAVGEMGLEYGIDSELSIDEHMCCGVGACFTCVCKTKTDKNEDGWRYSRTCNEGPVYRASTVHWD